MLVVFNDNGMSISENVGALTKMMARAMASHTLNVWRERAKRAIPKKSFFGRFFSRWEEHAKGMFVPSTLFEELGFHYTGPIDGHNIPQLLTALRTVKELPGPQLLHVITTKGKGYAPAEEAQIEYHAVGPFDPTAGLAKKAGPAKPTYTDIFSDWLCDMAATDDRLFGITPAMREGSGLVRFSREYPQRYFDVAIAEQHAVTLAAGMACEGAKPVVAIYSTFLQRAYDQAIHDVALQNLDVTFAIDRAGVVGPDGATHAGSFDLSFLRCLPNMVIMAPSDENECRQMLSTGFHYKGPAAVRYPRGTGPGAKIEPQLDVLPIGKGEIRRWEAPWAGHAVLRHHAGAGGGDRRRSGRHARQHALRQAFGRSPGAGTGAHARGVRDPRGQRDRRWGRCGRRGTTCRARHHAADPAPWPARCLPGTWLARGSAEHGGPGPPRHPPRHPHALWPTDARGRRQHRLSPHPERGGSGVRVFTLTPNLFELYLGPRPWLIACTSVPRVSSPLSSHENAPPSPWSRT